MNELIGITLLYESLIPIEAPENIRLSVGTVTLLHSDELPLDFKETHTAMDIASDSGTRFYVILKDLNTEAFAPEYRALGLSPEHFTYEFFRSRLHDTYVTEIYTEISNATNTLCLPLTLLRMHLYFSNGLVLDYSDRISIFALNELAEAA